LSVNNINVKANLEIKTNSIVYFIRNSLLFFVSKLDKITIVDISRNKIVDSKMFDNIEVGFTFALSKSNKHLIV